MNQVKQHMDISGEWIYQHCVRTADLTAHFMAYLGADIEDIKKYHRAALIHDVGKIFVRNLINKSGPLTDDEYEEVKNHSVLGVRYLSAIKERLGLTTLDFLAVRNHHERWDGRGYPDQLRENEIPYIARILALADSVDAMAVPRVYSEAKSPDWILTEIKRCSGTQFDPELAGKFCQMIKLSRGSQHVELFILPFYHDYDGALAA